MDSNQKDVHQSVQEVVLLHSVYDGTAKLNDFLSRGWVLLTTASGVDDQGYPIHTWTIGRIQ